MNPPTHAPDEDPPFDEDAREEEEWKRMAAEEFFRGYSEGDAIYDTYDQ